MYAISVVPNCRSTQLSFMELTVTELACYGIVGYAISVLRNGRYGIVGTELSHTQLAPLPFECDSEVSKQTISKIFIDVSKQTWHHWGFNPKRI